MDILYNNISGIKFGAIGLGGYVDGGKFDIGQRPLERSDIPRWGLSASDIAPLLRPLADIYSTSSNIFSDIEYPLTGGVDRHTTTFPIP